MGNRVAKVLDISGKFVDCPDYPVAVVREQDKDERSDESSIVNIVDPIFDWHITRNLYGRIMTLVEATTDMHKLNAVKDIFSKELVAWENDVYNSARELYEGGNSSSNLYTKNSIKNIS